MSHQVQKKRNFMLRNFDSVSYTLQKFRFAPFFVGTVANISNSSWLHAGTGGSAGGGGDGAAAAANNE